MSSPMESIAQGLAHGMCSVSISCSYCHCGWASILEGALHESNLVPWIFKGKVIFTEPHSWFLVEPNLASDPLPLCLRALLCMQTTFPHPLPSRQRSFTGPASLRSWHVGLSPEISSVMDFPCATPGHLNLPAWIQLRLWPELFYSNTSLEAHLTQCLVQFQNVWIFFPTLSPFLSSRYYLFINECKNRSFKICRAYSVTPWYFQQVNPTQWLHEEGGHILAPFFRWGNRCLGRLKDDSKVSQLARDRFSLVFFWRSYVYNKGRIFRISWVLFWDCVQPMEISLEILILWFKLVMYIMWPCDNRIP